MNYKLFVFSQTNVLFISDKEYISQSTRKVKTQNNNVFILKQKKNTSSTNLLLPEKLLSQSHVNNLPFLHFALSNANLRNAQSTVACFSPEQDLTKTFSVCLPIDLKMLISVLTPKT